MVTSKYISSERSHFYKQLLTMYQPSTLIKQ